MEYCPEQQRQQLRQLLLHEAKMELKQEQQQQYYLLLYYYLLLMRQQRDYNVNNINNKTINNKGMDLQQESSLFGKDTGPGPQESLETETMSILQKKIPYIQAEKTNEHNFSTSPITSNDQDIVGCSSDNNKTMVNRKLTTLMIIALNATTTTATKSTTADTKKMAPTELFIFQHTNKLIVSLKGKFTGFHRKEFRRKGMCDGG